MRKLLALSALLVLLDQGSKLAVKGFNLFGIRHEGMYLGESISVIGDFLRFTFVENPGMAFGLDFGLPLLLGLFSIGAAIFLVHLLRKSRNGKIGGFHIALAMILGGAVGNLIDRVFYGLFYGYAHLFKGKVVDFVDVNIPDITLFGRTWERFYIFNIADAAVSVGIVLLLIFYPKYQKEQMEAEERKKAEGKGGNGDLPPVADVSAAAAMTSSPATDLHPIIPATSYPDPDISDSTSTRHSTHRDHTDQTSHTSPSSHSSDHGHHSHNHGHSHDYGSSDSSSVSGGSDSGGFDGGGFDSGGFSGGGDSN